MTSEEILDKIHKLSLRILLAFDKICRENNLTYFLDSGTALGAVRHGGFIPWDDDVDVGMPRKDYEKFLQIAQKQLPENLFLQTRQTDSLYERNFAKIRLRETIFQEYKDLPYGQNGFFIDVFPFDNVPSNQYIAKIIIIISRLYYHFLASWYGRKDASSKVRQMIRKSIRRMPASQIESLNERYLRFCRKYEYKSTGYITCFFWRMTQHNTYIFDERQIFPTKDILFEGHPVRIMNNPDYYLSHMYGDYMTLPPENQRCNHHLNGLIDFGEYI